MNLEMIREIGKLLETTWGRSSSPDGTYSIKYDLQGERLTLKFSTVVHFADEAGLKPQIDAANHQAKQLIDAKIAEVKQSIRQALGETLRLEDAGGQDNLELIQPQGPRKIAYYRYNHAYNVQQ